LEALLIASERNHQIVIPIASAAVQVTAHATAISVPNGDLFGLTDIAASDVHFCLDSKTRVVGPHRVVQW
jgi:hypothetical protein